MLEALWEIVLMTLLSSAVLEKAPQLFVELTVVNTVSRRSKELESVFLHLKQTVKYKFEMLLEDHVSGKIYFGLLL